MQDKAQQRINRVHNGHLHQQHVWILVKVQFWPRIGYGFYGSTATLQELNRALHHQYYRILPLGGIVCTTTVKSWTINAGLFEVGLPYLGVEALIAMSNKLHYALWMQDCNRKDIANLLLTFVC